MLQQALQPGLYGIRLHPNKTRSAFDQLICGQEWGNLAGLVCPKYTALWFLLCLWVLGMMRFLRGFAAYVARTKA